MHAAVIRTSATPPYPLRCPAAGDSLPAIRFASVFEGAAR